MTGVLLVVLLVVIVAVVAIAGALIAMYNGLVKLNIKVEEAWSGITVQLKRRADMIPNLVETVKGYAAHTRAGMARASAARASAVRREPLTSGLMSPENISDARNFQVVAAVPPPHRGGLSRPGLGGWRRWRTRPDGWPRRPPWPVRRPRCGSRRRP